MKTELIAAISIAGIFAFKSAGNDAPTLTDAQKQQIAIHARCAQLNDKFMGSRDVYAQDRVTFCRAALNTINALIK